MFGSFRKGTESKSFKQGRSGKSSGRTGRMTAGRSRTPVLELLERRAMLTTFSPLPGTTDGAAGSLSADIIAAHADTGTIQLSLGTYASTIANSQSGRYETESLAGDLNIVSPAVISGAPSVTGATTTENVQTTSGLVITPGDTGAQFFQVTDITGGTLFQADGTTAVTNGSFITAAQGAAGLKFTPTTGSLSAGSFVVQGSTTDDVGGLTGTTATVPIAVTLSKPNVTNATTIENAQSTSGLVITPGPNDASAAFFQITSITAGTLYQNDGVTPIANGDFITLAQAAAGLKFTPGPNSTTAGGFTVQQSTTNAVGGLSGPTARAAITVTGAQPTFTGATTTENVQTTSGLVILPGNTGAQFFQISNIVGGTLFQADGTTA
ncbi:MAG TPA: hypothetical protein VHY91_23890, partial [Pirellulales bacterium]|nr:hypothetical protein [Pirellulales bacterium]